MSLPSVSWTVTAPVVAIAAVGPVLPSPVAVPTFLPEQAFGRGLTAPFRRDRKGDFANTSGKDLVVSAVRQILGTVSESEFNQGEMPWRPDFGSKLLLLKHAPNNQALLEIARLHVVEAVTRWEKRVRITDVQTTNEDLDQLNKLTITVRFNFIDLQTGRIIFEDLEASIQV